jgi:hypothetical protein
MSFVDIFKTSGKFDFGLSSSNIQINNTMVCKRTIFVYTFKAICDDGKSDRYHYSIKSDCCGNMYIKKCIKQKFLGIKHYKQLWRLQITKPEEGINAMINDIKKIHKGHGHNVVDIKAHSKVNTLFKSEETYELLCKVHREWSRTKK